MIRTERLHIIPLSYYELLSRVYSYSGMITNDEEQANVIEYSLKPMKEAPEDLQKFYTFWLGYCEGEEVIEVGFICPPTKDKVVEVFCYTKPEFQNKGFATESINGLVRFATAYDNIHHVCASVAKDNYASQRVFEKCGFKYLQDLVSGNKVYNLTIKN